MRELLSITLRQAGYDVTLAEGGDAAIERLRTESFELIVTDLRMPRLGGREFYEELRRRRPELASRVYFSTGDTVRGDTLAFLETLERPYLHKPFSLSELRTLLAEVQRDGADTLHP